MSKNQIQTITQPNKFILKFERLGRHKNISIPTKSSEPDDIFDAIDHNYKKYLLSSYIEVSYDPNTQKGDITAGFQHVGVFELKTDDTPPIQKTPPIPRIKKSKQIGSSGYISPEGDYYECGYQGHNDLADDLFDAGLTKKALRLHIHTDFEGWLHLSEGVILCDYNHRLTQKQIDFLADYFNKFKIEKMDINGISLTLKDIMENTTFEERISKRFTPKDKRIGEE